MQNIYHLYSNFIQQINCFYKYHNWIYHSLGTVEKISLEFLKGTVMQIEKALINYCLCVSKVPCKCHISIFYRFAVIYP